MKKYLVTALLLLGVVTMARAAEETNPILVSVYNSTTSAPSSLVFSGAGTVYGFVLSTGAATDYCVIRDTNTNNTTSTTVLPRVVFSTSVPQVITLPKPIRITNGLAMNNGATIVMEECAVLYRKGKLW
jgi:hypothetical protein